MTSIVEHLEGDMDQANGAGPWRAIDRPKDMGAQRGSRNRLYEAVARTADTDGAGAVEIRLSDETRVNGLRNRIGSAMHSLGLRAVTRRSGDVLIVWARHPDTPASPR